MRWRCFGLFGFFFGVHSVATAASAEWRCNGEIPGLAAQMQATRTTCERKTSGGRRIVRTVLWLSGGVNGKWVPDGRGDYRRVASSSAVVIPEIQRGRYDEVWLNSNGGIVDEGLAIGRALRKAHAVVRVIRHPEVFCISACTIIAMGGYNRIIDDGADFIVHAASVYLNLLRKETLDPLRCPEGMPIDQCGQRLASSLTAAVANIDEEARSSLSGSFTYYLEMLDGRPGTNIVAALARVPSPYEKGAPLPRSLRDDVALLRKGGAVSAQEILSQFELRSARLLLDLAEAEIRRNPGPYGAGAAESIALHQTMYTCRIQDLCSLSREQLMAAGYQNFEMADE